MSHAADISGAFQRPTLVDYLMVAEHQELDLSLIIYVGKLEVGTLGVRRGQLEYADMPGASGDTAVSLLLRLANARVDPRAGGPETANVQTPWRRLADTTALASSPGRSQRLAQIRAELRELESESQPSAESGVFAITDVAEGAERGLRVAAELLDWALLEAYLAGMTERARRLASERERIRPGELIAAANLERLRLRLLEDEIAAGLAEVEE